MVGCGALIGRTPQSVGKGLGSPGGEYPLSLKSGLQVEGLWAADLKGLMASVREAGKCGRGAEYQVHPGVCFGARCVFWSKPLGKIG